MTIHLYQRAHDIFEQQKKFQFLHSETLAFYRKDSCRASFEDLLQMFCRVIDLIRNRQTQPRVEVGESGKTERGECFALMNDSFTGLWVNAHEVHHSDFPDYTYYRATSLGLDDFCMSSDLYLIDGYSLKLLHPCQSLQVLCQSRQEMSVFNHNTMLLTSALGDLGYGSERGDLLTDITKILQAPSWPKQTGSPLKRFTLAQNSGAQVPELKSFLMALINTVNSLSDAQPIMPHPYDLKGVSGMAHDFVMTNRQGVGLCFGTNHVEPREQNPMGFLPVTFKLTGINNFFLASPRILFLKESDTPEQMQPDTYFDIHVSSNHGSLFYNRVLDAFSRYFGALGYALYNVEDSTTGVFPF